MDKSLVKKISLILLLILFSGCFDETELSLNSGCDNYIVPQCPEDSVEVFKTEDYAVCERPVKSIDEVCHQRHVDGTCAQWSGVEGAMLGFRVEKQCVFRSDV